MSAKALITLTVLALFFLSSVSAHGRLVSPPIRFAPGDENNGFTLARGPTKVNPCAGVAAGPVKSKFSGGQNVEVKWEIGAAHKGQCFIELSTDGESSFKVLKELPNCADASGNFQDTVALPNVQCDKCVMRFRWVATLTNELYLNCADVSISPGSAKRRSANKKRLNAKDQLDKEIRNFYDEVAN